MHVAFYLFCRITKKDRAFKAFSVGVDAVAGLSSNTRLPFSHTRNPASIDCATATLAAVTQAAIAALESTRLAFSVSLLIIIEMLVRGVGALHMFQMAQRQNPY